MSSVLFLNTMKTVLKFLRECRKGLGWKADRFQIKCLLLTVQKMVLKENSLCRKRIVRVMHLVCWVFCFVLFCFVKFCSIVLMLETSLLNYSFDNFRFSEHLLMYIKDLKSTFREDDTTLSVLSLLEIYMTFSCNRGFGMKRSKSATLL